MKYIQRFIATLILVLALVSVGLGYASGAVKAAEQLSLPEQIEKTTVQFLPPEISYQIPYNPHIAAKEADYPDLKNKNIVFFDSFAWQTFAALNWPSDCQGEPLTDKKIGEDPSAPRVWEFYRSPQDVFLTNGQNPTTIQPKKPFPCQNRSNQKLSLMARITESGLLAGADSFDNFDDENRNLIEEISTPLVDQQGNYVINEVHINPDEFNQILRNKWFDARNLEQSNFQLVCSKDENNQSRGVPCGGHYDQVGAIDIKAAWRVFNESNSNDDKARYYTTKRQLSIPAKMSATNEEFEQEVDLGLIGFHITQKTSEQGWIWSTFEQVDNVPNDAEAKGKYTLYNSNCKKCEPDNAVPTYLWRQEPPHAVWKDNKGKIIEQIPSQITRLSLKEKQLGEEALKQVEELNKQWQNALKPSIWQYYKLIGTAWLRSPEDPYGENRVISPTQSLVNVTLEPFQQSNSCIACHTSANLPNQNHADFSFQLLHAQPSNSSAIPTQ